MELRRHKTGSPDDPRPLYVQIMESLRRQILSGEIKGSLTSEIELAQQLGTSRGTVKQAIGGLVREGLLRRRRGSGTFVNEDSVENYYSEISSFTGSMQAQGLSPVVRVHEFRQQCPSAETARSLALNHDEPIYFYSRSVLLEGTVRVFTVSYLPASRFPGLSISAPAESLYKILRRDFGATPSWASDSYTPALADGNVAAGLEVEAGTPLFRIERVTLDQARAPIEHAMSWFASGRIVVDISPMSLVLERQVFAPKATPSQWHHHVVTRY